jgi:hypothetical protein
VYITAVRIHQRTIYLDQGRQGLGSSYERTWDTLSSVHRRLSTRSTLPATCFSRTEDCRRSFRAQLPHTGSRQGCLGDHSDSPRSPWCGDFNRVSHRLDQGPPTTIVRYFKISQGHPVSVHPERKTCSIRPPHEEKGDGSQDARACGTTSVRNHRACFWDVRRKDRDPKV